MSIITTILHPIKSAEKKVLLGIASSCISKLPIAKRKVKELLEKYGDEILELLEKVIERAITDLICKKMEEQGNQIYIQSDN